MQNDTVINCGKDQQVWSGMFLIICTRLNIITSPSSCSSKSQWERGNQFNKLHEFKKRKKKLVVRVSYGEEREGWQWEGAGLIWSSVICRLDPCTQNMLRLKEMERGRENRNPCNPSGILMLLFRPHGDFRDRRWAWKGITAKPFRRFQKICSKLLWEQIWT